MLDKVTSFRGHRVADQSWVRKALQGAGRTQKDLAQAWGVSEAAVSRFIAGSESQDPPASRVWTLSQLIGWEVKDVIKQLGLAGPVPDLPPVVTNPEAIPVGTRIFEPRREGARVVLNLNLPIETAMELFRVLGSAADNDLQGRVERWQKARAETDEPAEFPPKGGGGGPGGRMQRP